MLNTNIIRRQQKRKVRKLLQNYFYFYFFFTDLLFFIFMAWTMDSRMPEISGTNVSNKNKMKDKRNLDDGKQAIDTNT